MTETIGMTASVVVALSFFMNGEKRIRLVNTIGSLLFLFYGVLIHSISLVSLNVLSCVVNLIKVHRILKNKN